MSLNTCIPGLVQRGDISPEKGKEMAEMFAEMRAAYKVQLGDEAADAMAGEATLAALERKAMLSKRQTGQQIRRQQAALKSIESFKGGLEPGVPMDPRAAVALLDRDSRAPYSNVEGRHKAVRARAHAGMDKILADHSRDVVGRVRNRAQLDDIENELFGKDTGSLAAKELADSWSQTAEMLRQRFNAAGGDIGKLDRWGLPQSHDTRAVRNAGFDQWRADILPGLAVDRMVDKHTGLPFTADTIEPALRDAFETIRSDGWNKREPGGAGNGKLANQRQDPRFFIFKDADAWRGYQTKYGAGTSFDAMMGHIDGMSRDIAMMEILGPNPTATIDWLKDRLMKSAETDASPGTRSIDKAFAGTKQIDRLYSELSGGAGRPENRTLALAFSSVRSLQTAAKLGSALLSAVTDTGFQMSTRKFNGLAGSSMIRDYAKLFRPGAIEDQKLAVRLGLIATEWGQRASAQSRYLGEELTGEIPRRLAEGVLRVSGLSRWTEAGRWAFGMEFMGHITDESVKSLDKVNPAFRGALQRYGIDAAAWDKIRATPLEQDRGQPWLKPANVEDRELGDKLLEMILSETDYAVPTPDLRTRAMMNSFAPKGTFIGEVGRSALLFKSFGISMLITQGRRIMEQAGPDAARYAAGLFIGTTLTGALALQLKAIAGGKDPRAMDDKEFWGASVLQGGGFGIFGDFLQSAENRFGGGFAETLAGPIIGDLQSIADVAKSKKPAWAAAKLARQELPGGSLWYLKLAFDRLVTDQIQESIDPTYRQSWQRMAKRARDQRTSLYWEPGETAPDRGPDLTNAIGGKK